MEYFVERLQKELEIDEGCKYEVYLDHLGLPTFGIGHLVFRFFGRAGPATPRVSGPPAISIWRPASLRLLVLEDLERFWTVGEPVG